MSVCPFVSLSVYLSLCLPVCACVDLSRFLLFSQSSDIRRISLDTADSMLDVVLPLRGLQAVTAMDFDPQTDQVYWADVARHTVSRACWDGSRQQVPSTSLCSLTHFLLLVNTRR